jgi:hypothetical protein
MGDNLEKMIKLIGFSGKVDDWCKWSMKFLARANYKKYHDVLLGDVAVPENDMELDLATEEGLAFKKARDANKVAYSKLLMCCDDDVSFAIIDTACTTELPRGCAKTAWQGIVDKFEPKTSASMVKLRRQFAECVLDDPTRHPEEMDC